MKLNYNQHFCIATLWVLMAFSFLFRLTAQQPLSIKWGRSFPSLIAISSADAPKAIEEQLKIRLRSESLIDYDIRLFHYRHGQSGWVEGQRFFYGHFNLTLEAPGTTAWVLVDREGQRILAGQGVPEESTLLKGLINGGVLSWMARLKAFLLVHPEHLEARRDLLQQFVPRLAKAIQELPQLAAPTLDPASDQALFGSFAEHLEPYLRSEAWIALETGLEELLPRGIPEGRSPIMRACYGRVEPGLRHLLRRHPYSPSLWTTWLRVQRVLGRSDTRAVLEALAYFHAPGEDLGPFPAAAIGQSLAREAKRTGDPAGVVEPLSWLWRHFADPALFSQSPEGSAMVSSPQAEEAHRLRLDAAQKAILLPLMEAMVRTGRSSHIPGLLASSRSLRLTPVLRNGLLQLSTELGQPELLISWLAALRQRPEPVNPSPLLVTALTLVHQYQPPADVSRILDSCNLQGFELGEMDWNTQSDVATADLHRRQFGWSSGEPRWSLLDARGTPLLHGHLLPSPSALLQSCRQLGLKTVDSPASDFLTQHPGHAKALARRIAAFQFRLSHAGHTRENATRNGALERVYAPAELELWGRFIQDLQSLWEDPAAFLPAILEHHPWISRIGYAPDPGADESMEHRMAATIRVELPPEASADLSRLALSVLPSLEAELKRRPGDERLWMAWLAWSSWHDIPHYHFLQEVTPSPFSKEIWPPEALLKSVTRDMLLAKAWSELLRLTLPLWRERLRREEDLRLWGVRMHGSFLNWDWDITRSMLEAFINLGRWQDASRILEDLETYQARTGDLTDLFRLATRMNQETWAQGWTSRLRKRQGRSTPTSERDSPQLAVPARNSR